MLSSRLEYQRLFCFYFYLLKYSHIFTPSPTDRLSVPKQKVKEVNENGETSKSHQQKLRPTTETPSNNNNHNKNDNNKNDDINNKGNTVTPAPTLSSSSQKENKDPMKLLQNSTQKRTIEANEKESKRLKERSQSRTNNSSDLTLTPMTSLPMRIYLSTYLMTKKTTTTIKALKMFMNPMD